jgi:hypothetical protein
MFWDVEIIIDFSTRIEANKTVLINLAYIFVSLEELFFFLFVQGRRFLREIWKSFILLWALNHIQNDSCNVEIYWLNSKNGVLESLFLLLEHFFFSNCF